MKYLLLMALLLLPTQAHAQKIGFDPNAFEITPDDGSTAGDLSDLLSADNILNYSGEGGVVVILGSSTAAGVGATGYTSDPNNTGAVGDTSTTPDASWVGQFCDSLGSNFTCYNQSISGSQTSTSIARFDTDVVPLKPNYVIFATALWNESNFASSPLSVTENYLQNIKQLAKMATSIGAVPVIHGPYPKDTATTATCNAARSVYYQLEKDFPAVFDFMNGLDDGDCTYKTGMSSDGTHPTDAGYDIMSEAIVDSFFTEYNKNKPTQVLRNSNSFKYITASIASPLEVTFDKPLTNWAMRVRFKSRNTTNDSQNIMSCDNGAGTALRVRYPAGVLGLSDTGTNIITSSVNLQDAKEHEVVVTYDSVSELVYIYVDGVSAGSGTPDQIETKDNFVLAGRYDATSSGVNIDYSDFAIWRTYLTAADVSRMYETGIIPKKSLEFFATLDGDSANTIISNLSASSAVMINNTTLYGSSESATFPTVRYDTDTRSVSVGDGLLATTATSGFLYIPRTAGTPTGTPETKDGYFPLVIDSANHKLYFYDGTWRDAGP